MKKVKALWGRIPSGFKKQVGHVISVFVVTFVATASPAIPSVLSQVNVGHVPAFSSVKAVIAASFAAGLRAAAPVVRVALVKLCFAVVRYEERKGGIGKAVVQEVVANVPEASVPGVRYVDGMVSR